MERCQTCGAPVEHSAPDGDLRYHPHAAEKRGRRIERERIIAALRNPGDKLLSDMVSMGKQYGETAVFHMTMHAACRAVADWIEREFADKAT